MRAMTPLVMVGEGTAEPTVGIRAAADLVSPDPVSFFFGVRRTPEGLPDSDRIASVTTNMPAAGLRRSPTSSAIVPSPRAAFSASSTEAP